MPWSRSFAAAASPFFGSRDPRTTTMPCLPSSRAVSKPRPRLAPVINATFPFFIFVPFTFLEGIRSVHEQTYVCEVIHRAKEHEQAAGDGPAKTNDVDAFTVPFCDRSGCQQRTDRNQTPQHRQKAWFHWGISEVAANRFLRWRVSELVVNDGDDERDHHQTSRKNPDGNGTQHR